MHKDCTFEPNKTGNGKIIDASVLSDKLYKDSEEKKARLKLLMEEKLSKEKET